MTHGHRRNYTTLTDATFIGQRSFTASDFVIRTDGVCRLSPQLARMVASLFGN